MQNKRQASKLVTPVEVEGNGEIYPVVKGFRVSNKMSGEHIFCYTIDDVFTFLNKNKDWKNYTVQEGMWPSFLFW